MNITPTIGRIVYHVGSDGQIRPAIITHVWSQLTVNLQVFPKDSSDSEAGTKTSVGHAAPAESTHPAPQSWHWMPYQVGQAKAQATIQNTESLPPAHAMKGSTVTAMQISALLSAATFTDTKMGEKSTVVCAKLANGFEIIESSGCVDPANYNHATGVDICKKRIAERLWQLDGYALQVALAKG